jgi:hypothetical protein
MFGILTNVVAVQELGALSDLVSASMAGAVTAVASNPVWLVNTKMMLKSGEKVSMGDAFRKIHAEGGMMGFMDGVGGAMGTVQ